MDNRNNTNDIIVTATDTTSVEDTTTATAVKQHGGKVKGFFSALNSKRKKLMLSLTTALTMAMMSSVSAFAAPAPGAGGGGIGGDAGEAQFNAVISFFAVWIGRIGLVVGFIGAVMFALAIKNDDADAKTRGLMTMASGFVVFAVTQALSLFGITA